MITGSKLTLLTLVKQKGTLSMDKAVELTDLSKTTIREHMLQLEQDGYIHREFVRSGPGRPSLQYQIRAKGNRLFPSAESDLLRQLLRHLREEGQEHTMEAFFESYWEERLQQASQCMNEASSVNEEHRLSALMSFLAGEGFMPEYERDNKRSCITIKECNCPFSEVIKETRLPCRLEAGFYRKLFDAEVSRTHYIAEGDFSCTYQIPFTDKKKG